jgi:DNA-binding transcriptional ArsR family regulator
MLKYRDPVDMVFHALGDPNRRLMMDRLSRRSMSVSDLAGPLGISLPAAMQHLQVLQDSGLVRSEKVGRVRTCHVRGEAMRQAERWMAQRREEWEQRLDRLGEYLAEHPDNE